MAHNYLKSKGELLLRAGFPIIPLASGSKGPRLKGWQNAQADALQVASWLKSDYKDGAGVGIQTRFFPAIDLDIDDPEIIDELLAWAHKHLNIRLYRVGRAPRVLIPFQLASESTPFSKRISCKYTSPDHAKSQQIELLADGQQYVAYHTHPDTGNPYKWYGYDDDIALGPFEDDLIDHRGDELPTLVLPDVERLFKRFEMLATRKKWQRISGGMTSVARDIDDDDLGALENYKQPLGWSIDEIRDILEQVEVPAAHDEWVPIGMALHHETEGANDGLELWHEWSAGGEGYDASLIDTKWRSFDMLGNGNTITLASVIARANLQRRKKKETDLKDLIGRVADAETRYELTESVPREAAELGLNDFMLEEVATAIRDRYKDLTGARLPIAQARKLLDRDNLDRIRITADIRQGRFNWLNDWVYVSGENLFFNTRFKYGISPDAFDRVHDQRLITARNIAEGKYTPTYHASTVARNVMNIPVCQGIGYAPEQGAVYDCPLRAGNLMANVYEGAEIEDVPRHKWDEDQAELAKRLDLMLTTLSSRPEDQLIFKQWLKCAVTNLGEKECTWSIVLQGGQGSGKSVWTDVIASMLGRRNVKTVNGKEVVSGFTEWAADSCVSVIEEIKLDGKDKWAAMNGLKTYITNQIVSITRKHRPSADTMNYCTYLLTSQYKDCLPLDESDRRIYPIFSPLQTRADIQGFIKEHGSTWWGDTVRMVQKHPEVIKAWAAEVSMDGFDYTNAPMTDAKRLMANLSTRDEDQFIISLLEDPDLPHISYDLLMTKDITDQNEIQDEPIALSNRAMGSALARLGLNQCCEGRRVKVNGQNRSFWTRSDEVQRYSPADIRALYDSGKRAFYSDALDDDFIGDTNVYQMAKH